MRKSNILGRGLIGLVVGASSFMGCEEPQGNYNDNQQQRSDDAGQAGLDLLQFTLGLYGVAGDGTPEQRNAAGFTSNLIGEEKRNEAIRNSGTTVNVYNGQGQQYNSKSFSTAFNYWIDENRDGYASPNELKGARDTFYLSKEKQINFGIYITGKMGKTIEFRLYCMKNNRWQEVILKKFSIPYNDYFGWVGFNTKDLCRAGVIGKSIVNFRVEDEFVDSYYVNLFD